MRLPLCVLRGFKKDNHKEQKKILLQILSDATPPPCILYGFKKDSHKEQKKILLQILSDATPPLCTPWFQKRQPQRTKENTATNPV
jgi:hypothetical protein